MGGESPISFLAIDAYARRHDIDRDDFPIFRTLLAAIDTEWLAYVREKAKADAEMRKNRAHR